MASNFALTSLGDSTYRGGYAFASSHAAAAFGKGTSWRAGGGRVKRTAFLNILWCVA